MTLASATTKVSYAGNGSTASFSVTFVYWDNTDIEVILRSSAGVETTWVLNTQYTLSGGGGSTGTLTVDTSPTDYTPASGETLVIRSKRADTQGTALPLGGAFPSTNVEQAIDQIVRMVQQKEELLGRTLSVPKTDTATDLELPIDSERASKFAAFDASGNIIASTGPTGDSTIPVTSYIETLLDDSNSGAALTTLLAAGTAIVNTFSATQRWAKGGDLSSASPLVLDTDGNYFDVTGTTGFSAITVAAGTFFMLQFDGVLTLTHGSTLDLPGEANIITAAGDRLIGFAEAANTVQVVSYFTAANPPGRGAVTAQKPITVASSALATNSTAVPTDDTIPQNTEGDEVFTAAITPKATANRLVIDVHILCSTAAAGRGIVAALFQDTTANALAATGKSSRAADQMEVVSFQHEMAAGTTSATTFKVRAGNNTGSMYINGISTGPARIFGGVASSRMTITEYWA